MASKRSVVTVVDEVTSVEVVDAAMDFSVVEAVSEAMAIVDEAGVVVEEVLVGLAAQTTLKAWAMLFARPLDFLRWHLRFVISKLYTCNLSLLVWQHRWRMLQRHCICVMMAG